MDTFFFFHLRRKTFHVLKSDEENRNLVGGKNMITLYNQTHFVLLIRIVKSKRSDQICLHSQKYRILYDLEVLEDQRTAGHPACPGMPETNRATRHRLKEDKPCNAGIRSPRLLTEASVREISWMDCIISLSKRYSQLQVE
ncbi:hypothetical protein BaRGS_00010572 [Batillaria attramentaria]|uniref:Uncharacterized protein n=1 Tax=Batillaria attramentaria TaxID=370345 RepID=A0ABD0LGX2_9CAEN